MNTKPLAVRNVTRKWQDEADTLRADDVSLSGHRGEILAKAAGTTGPQTARAPADGPQHLPGVLVINEIDSDTVSTDVLEFVELYDGGLGNMSLNGYVLVFFNGSNDQSYLALDLDGFTTDASGYFVAGNTAVAGVDLVFAGNLLQNGQDAVALYTGNATDFPNGTAPTTTNLVDAIVYDTADADDPGLLTGLGETTQYDEGAGGAGNPAESNALARVPNETGGFVAQAPTPGAVNVGPTLPTLSINDVTLSEGDAGTTTFTFSVTLSAPAGAGGVTFDIATADGTAQDDNPPTEDNDYVPISLTGQTIAAGSTGPYIFSVTVNSDTASEPNETFFVNITNVTGATVLDGQGLGTITDDDSHGTISVNSPSGVEGDTGTTPGSFTLSRSGGSVGTVTVDYVITLPGGAGGADGSDVSATLTGTVTFLNGETSATIPYTVNGDRNVETDETFTIELSSPTGGAILGTAVGTATITNDDVAGSVSVADISIVEGDSGQSMVTITLTRTGGSGDFTVDYDTSDDSATIADDDYEAVSGTASFTGGATIFTFQVPINGDTVSEGDESFFVTLSNATSGATISDDTASITITDDEGAGTVSISDAQVVESDSGTVNLVFTLTRSGGSTPFDVTVTTSDDSAVAPGDYAADSQVVSFGANDTTATFTVVVNGDTDIEPDETLFATLSAATAGAAIGTGTGVGTITTDDFAAGSVSIADAQVVEGNGGTVNLVLTVTRSGGAAAFAVDFATAAGGALNHAQATAGVDYTASSGTLNFALNQMSATISIPISPDLVAELSEEFLVNLLNATNGATIGDGQAIATITTDDFLTANSALFSEAFTPFTGGGFAPVPAAGQLDSDIWRVGGLTDSLNPAYGFTGITGDFARGTINGNADPTTGGVYSHSANSALIVQPTGSDFESNGFIEARIQNTSGGTANGLSIDFDWAYRNSGDRADTMVFSYSTDGTNFTAVPASNLVTPTTQDALVAAIFTNDHESVTLTGLSIANLGFIYFRWTHTGSTGSGNRDEVGIDNVVLNGTVTAGPAVAVSDVSVNEAAGTMTFTIARTNVAAGAFTVQYATADDTAIAGQDYSADSGTLSFAANQTQATVTISIADDGAPEFDDRFFLNLFNASGATIADPQAIGTIVNDDGTPIAIAIGDVTLLEGDAGTTTATFTVTRTGGTGAFDVTFNTANGSATEPSDYLSNSGTLNFGVGVNSQTISVTINGDLVVEPNETFSVLLSNPTNGALFVDSSAVGTILNGDFSHFIHDIQGTAYFSPILAGESISAFNVASAAFVSVRAVVTAIDNDGTRQGFYIQEEITDWDGNNYTSEGIFVMTRNDANAGTAVAGVAVGDLVTVTAHVMEYQGFATNMPITALTSPTWSVISGGNQLPTLLLDAGYPIPNAVFTAVTPDYTDSADGVGDTFDASQYGLSYWETVEGMLVTIPDMVVADGFVSTSGGQPYFQAYSLVHANADQINSRGGYTIAGDPPLGPPDTIDPGDNTVRDGRHVHDGDINPDLIEVDFTGFAIDAPAGLTQNATMGDRLGDVTGIIDFDFTDRKLFVTDIDIGDVTNGVPTVETTAFGDDSRSLTVATFNVENLDPTDGAARFTALANAIANNLNAPDIISIEEIQDNNGAAAGDGSSLTGTDASITWQMLVDALNLATGAHYQWVDQAPIYNAEGGEQSGNIRVGFLYNTDRVQLGDLAANATLTERRQYTDRIGDGVRDAGDLIAYSDNMIAGEINTADWTTTRRSLLGEFTFNGNTVYVTANHWPSKGGSGEIWQFNQNLETGQPTNSDWAQRNAVAQDVYTMLDLIQSGSPDAGIVAGGDFNDFYFYRPLTTVTGHTMADGSARIGGARFENLTLTLAEAERYTYAFDGRSQAIDHIIVNGLLGDVASYDIVHLNTGFNTRGSGVNASPALSDHEPALSSFDFREFSERLNGTATADYIQGFGGNDTITGGDGDDVLDGGDGHDGLTGGSGADRLIGGAGNDYGLGGIGDDFLIGGTGNDVMLGEDGSDTLLGEGDDDRLEGGAGIDGIVGGAGADYIDGGADGDYLFGEDGIDTILGQGGDDRIESGAGVDGVLGGAGADYIDGGADGDFLYGEDGADGIIGGVGADYIDGGADGDFLFGEDGIDTIMGQGGDDRIEAGAGRDGVVGGAGADYIDGGEDGDFLYGEDGDDTVIGGDGGDVIYGGAGNDGLVGGSGADLFVFATALGAGNVDFIDDFFGMAVDGEDQILLDHNIFTGLATGALSADQYVVGTQAQDADDRIIYDSTTGALYFDADGNGAGTAVQFAQLQSGAALTALDIIVF